MSRLTAVMEWVQDVSDRVMSFHIERKYVLAGAAPGSFTEWGAVKGSWGPRVIKRTVDMLVYRFEDRDDIGHGAKYRVRAINLAGESEWIETDVVRPETKPKEPSGIMLKLELKE